MGEITGRVLPPHVGPLGGGDLDDGGCTTCAECDYDAGHDGPCDCGHETTPARTTSRSDHA